MSVMINDPDEVAVFQAIMNEVEASKIKHPHYPTDILRRGAIVAEEAGEVLKEALNATRASSSETDHKVALLAMKAETIQTAAAAWKLLIALEKER